MSDSNIINLNTVEGRAEARRLGLPVAYEHAPDIQRLADLIDGAEAQTPAWGPERISEKSFMWKVLNRAKELGWTLQYHTFDSRRSQPGFPDVVLARGPGFAVRLIVAELKVGKRQPTTAQYAWLAAFEGAGVHTYVWRPEDWPEIEELLKGGQTP